MLELTGTEASGRVAQLEGPKEIASLLEVGPHGDDFVDKILDADDAVLAQVVLDEGVVGQRDALLVDFAVPALVDEFAHRLHGRVAVGDVRFDDAEHFHGGFGESDEDAVVDLQEAEELEDLAGFGGDFVDTTPKKEKKGNVSASVGGGWFLI